MEIAYNCEIIVRLLYYFILYMICYLRIPWYWIDLFGIFNKDR